MSNKTAATLGVVLAIFISMGLILVFVNAWRQCRRDPTPHRRDHHTRLDDWIRTRNSGDEERGLPARPNPVVLNNSRRDDSVDSSDARTAARVAASSGGISSRIRFA